LAKDGSDNRRRRGDAERFSRCWRRRTR